MQVIGQIVWLLLPAGALGTTFGVWVFQSSGSVIIAVFSAVAFLVIQCIGVGIVYGTINTRLNNFEKNLQMVVDNSILELKVDLHEIYQTKAACSDQHHNRNARGANG